MYNLATLESGPTNSGFASLMLQYERKQLVKELECRNRIREAVN